MAYPATSRFSLANPVSCASPVAIVPTKLPFGILQDHRGGVVHRVVAAFERHFSAVDLVVLRHRIARRPARR